ncbi:SDR family NAD(P)-dependent oxidoreductase [Halomonas salinarum]|uniref:SDR family NAD(P)-dependent oxidoreductase n=1 Tax=Halomonas salinarum TaxID=1158993 RepID=UPI00143A13C8|nr:SDR family oxidoreductase [Halomonas salinarum]
MSQVFASFSLAGKTALLTGATGYLGEQMAMALASAGARVLVNSRSRQRADLLVERLKDNRYTAEPLVFDVTDPGAVNEIMDVLQGQALHILINNAYAGRGGTVETANTCQYQDSYEMVVSSAHRILQACLPALREAVRQDGDASVINIASMYGMVSPDPRMYDSPASTNPPFYGAAKAALIQWSRYASCELGNDGIRVNSISPGPFPAEGVEEANPGFVEKLASRVPLGRIGRAEELQGPLLFLASSASSFVTGSNLVVDGGWTAW